MGCGWRIDEDTNLAEGICPGLIICGAARQVLLTTKADDQQNSHSEKSEHTDDAPTGIHIRRR